MSEEIDTSAGVSAIEDKLKKFKPILVEMNEEGEIVEVKEHSYVPLPEGVAPAPGLE